MECSTRLAFDSHTNALRLSVILESAPIGNNWFLRLSIRPRIPPMGHPCFSDQPADHDDTVREADQRVNDPDLTLLVRSTTQRTPA